MKSNVYVYLIDSFADDTLKAWYNLYKTQDSNFFYDLMSSMEKQK